ncbi:hypothetical protein CLCR_00844 [Cladophialophora carrionii]|uniref:BTB domain-containing protein n=1 Tax=Cladophialophora carrionii TaxID=86049 RepID=A0A1C1D146_9EURO|nr:hypothetical protein CLCR_00844 [Cladophialophora carrionii]
MQRFCDFSIPKSPSNSLRRPLLRITDMPRRGVSLLSGKRGGDASASSDGRGRDNAHRGRTRKTVKTSIVEPKDGDTLRPLHRKRKAPGPDTQPPPDTSEDVEIKPGEPPVKRQAISRSRHENPPLPADEATPLEADEHKPHFNGIPYDKESHCSSPPLPPADAWKAEIRQHIGEENAETDNDASTSNTSAATKCSRNIPEANPQQESVSSGSNESRAKEVVERRAVTAPLSAVLRPRPVLHFISDQRALEQSARAWTTAKSKVSITQNGDLVMKYRHQIPLPSNPHPAIFHICLPTARDGGWKNVDISAEILSQSSYLINQMVNKFGFVALEDGYVNLGKVSEDVLEACLAYLEGGYLYITLPAPPLSDEFKRKLLEFTHVAHVFNIPILMRTAMHAFCTAYHRCVKDLCINEVMRHVVLEATFEGNPVSRYLASTPPERIITGMICRDGLPHEKADIDRICTVEHDQWHRIWSGEAKKFPRYPCSEKFVKERAASR